MVGYSPYGGQTYAAYHAHQNPAGSSCGSAVAVDLGLALAAIGTDTGGSITFPADRNNIVAIKPTVGLVSRHLVIPASEHRDTVGPMARTVRDAAQLLQVLAGPDPADNYTSAIPAGRVPDYAAAAAAGSDALRGARIGVPFNYLGLSEDVDSWDPSRHELVAPFRDALRLLQAAGAAVVEANLTRPDPDRQPANSTFTRDEQTTLGADLGVGLAAYLSQLTENPAGVWTLADLRERTQAEPAEENDIWGTSVWDDALDLGFDNTDARFWAAHQRLLKAQGPDGLLGALERQNLTAVALPAAAAPWTVNLVGAPVVTVPMGFYPPGTNVTEYETEKNQTVVYWGPGVPFGLSFVGRPWSEPDLIGLAYGYEQRTRTRTKSRPRTMVPKAELAMSASCRA
ncbi:hypothetical protein CDD83_5178 [Cordyceps sp. RAO-2017]|nr:hypothetical protein CDD83_5178 [Cordyceps sp. RAO-2017]